VKFQQPFITSDIHFFCLPVSIYLFIYLYVYGLFNEIISTPDRTTKSPNRGSRDGFGSRKKVVNLFFFADQLTN
jgi:hypothetical protein